MECFQDFQAFFSGSLTLTAKLIIVSSYHLFRRESSAIEWRKGIISFTVNRNQSPILACPCKEKEWKFFNIFQRSSHHRNQVVQLKTLALFYSQELAFPAVFSCFNTPVSKGQNCVSTLAEKMYSFRTRYSCFLKEQHIRYI